MKIKIQKSKLKSQKYKSPPKADPPSEEKVKTLIISSHCEERSDEAIPKMNYEFLISNFE